jgi:hypothetical protein
MFIHIAINFLLYRQNLLLTSRRFLFLAILNQIVEPFLKPSKSVENILKAILLELSNEVSFVPFKYLIE